MKRITMRKTMAALLLTMLMASSASAAFKFGVMCDTQWIGTDDGLNPNSAAVGIIKQLNTEFINKGVKFVIQTGDLSDSGATIGSQTTAIFRQDLYNNGIGFYPLRGNHESTKQGALDFVSLFPQSQDACKNNLTPSTAYSVANADSAQPNPTQSGSPFCVGTISATPVAPAGYVGLNYALDYENVRFVFLDQFTLTDGTAHSTINQTQIDWMDGQLSGRPANTHAFVYGHKAVISQNHTDGLFGLPSDSPTLTNNFVKSLANRGVHIYMGGHDHMHNRALVDSPDHTARVQDIVMGSDSSKFYIPYGTAGYTKRVVNPTTKAVSNSGTLTVADSTQTNDYIYNVLVAGNTTRETPLAQELNTVGYYIYSVDGPKVTVDYYSAVINPTLSSGEYLISTTPNWTTATFAKRETFGYSLNGIEKLVSKGASYALTDNTDKAIANGETGYFGTTAKILSGTNGSTATDSAGRTLTKDVNTGWAPKTADTFSDVLSLWGMTDLGATSTDKYTLSMTFDPSVKPADVSWTTWINQGNLVVLSTKDQDGNWIKAVDANVGGGKKFVLGPWKSSNSLGTFGVDPNTNTVWAVINATGSSQFAAVRISN